MRDNTWPFEVYDPEIEWENSDVGLPSVGFEPVYRGHAGMRAFWRQWRSLRRSSRYSDRNVARSPVIPKITSASAGEASAAVRSSGRSPRSRTSKPDVTPRSIASPVHALTRVNDVRFGASLELRRLPTWLTA
jgi:hypothetical protein